MSAVDPTLRRWTIDEYHTLAEMGWFREQRVELLDGSVLVKARPTDLHTTVLNLSHNVLSQFFTESYWIRVQQPLRMGENSEVEPDIAIVKGSPGSYPSANSPNSAVLVVEISDTTLHYDCGQKASLYAAHGILDYWVVNLKERCLEVRRHVVHDPGQHFGMRFQTLNRYGPDQSAIPMVVPSALISVADILP